MARKVLFKDGQRVRLRAIAAGTEGFPEGLPEEIGKVLGDGPPKRVGEPMYVVEVDRKYRENQWDDGLREVSQDQMEAL